MYRAFIVSGLALLSACGALAQDTPPPVDPKQSPVATIIAKNSLTDEDRSAIRGEITRNVEAITGGNGNAEAAAAAARLRADYALGSPAGKEAFAALCIEIVSGGYKSAQLAPATQLLGVLAALNETPAYKVFIEATTDARPGVRAAGVAGLRGLRQKLALAGGSFFSESVEALRAAGKKETSTVGLRSIYQALNFPEAAPNVPDAKLLATAVFDILETRSEQYASKSVKGEGADHTGLALVNSLRSSLSEVDREKLIPICARMMLYAVHRYTADGLVDLNDKSAGHAQLEARNAAEMLIDECEKILLDLLKPPTPPGLSKAMRDPEKDKGGRRHAIRTAMGAWGEILKTKTGQKYELDESPGGGG